MAKKKMTKKQVEKAHEIARAINRSRKGPKPKNPWAAGMAAVKKQARKRKRSK